jgi:uncharacterized cupin superfamily protein
MDANDSETPKAQERPTQHGCSIASCGAAESTQVVRWIEAPRDALTKGDGLGPYPEGGTSALFDWAENPNAGSAHLMPHFGQFIVDIVEIDDNAVHQPSKPGDEIVVVLEGTLSLTTDCTGVEQIITAGEIVLIPAGWAGVYRARSGPGRFRELAIVPGDYFDPSAVPPPSGKSPRRIEPPIEPGRHELHRNRYAVEAANIERQRDWPITAACDEVIQVLAGTLTLTTAGDSASFGAGSVVILPAGFTGTAWAAAGCRTLIARWIR